MNITEQSKDQDFVTDDLNLAAMLVTYKIDPIQIDSTDPSKALFTFHYTTELVPVLTAYFNRSDPIPRFLVVRRKLLLRIKRHDPTVN